MSLPLSTPAVTRAAGAATIWARPDISPSGLRHQRPGNGAKADRTRFCLLALRRAEDGERAKDVRRPRRER